MTVDLATFSPKRILVCQLRQIGDVVLATPSIELLKRRYPDAEIHLLTEKKCAPLLAVSYTHLPKTCHGKQSQRFPKDERLHPVFTQCLALSKALPCA